MAFPPAALQPSFRNAPERGAMANATASSAAQVLQPRAGRTGPELRNAQPRTLSIRRLPAWVKTRRPNRSVGIQPEESPAPGSGQRNGMQVIVTHDEVACRLPVGRWA